MEDSISVTDKQQVKQEQLGHARQRILEALVPLLGQLNGVEPEKKFDICLSALRFTNDDNLLGATIDAALAIEDPTIKAESLLTLMNEVDFLGQN